MKRTMGWLLALLMISFCAMAGAEEIPLYQRCFSNEASFETLEEAHANGPAQLQALTGLNYMPDPALDSYAAGTTYVYRSAGIFTSSTAAYRMNTNILVYTDAAFESKDAALAYLKELGVTELVDQAHGSAVLVTPIDPAAGFGAADQYDFLKLQAAMCNLGARSPEGDFYYADNTYFGGLTYRYAIGIGGGADFLCDYIANTLDYAGRIAGMLLVQPTMDKRLDVACNLPVYLVNGTDDIVKKFIAANEAYACEETKETVTYYNPNFPVQKVVIAKNGEKALVDSVKDAYYGLFVKAMRTPVVKGGMYVAANEFAGYNWNQAPYTLTERNAVLDGVTADGIHMIERQEDRFAEFRDKNGESLRTWYEFLPEEALNGTAKEHSIPLILCNHGGGDDPVQAADEMGLITLAGKERVAVVAPRYASDIPGSSLFDGSPFDLNGQTLPALVRYMLDTYPALDPARVYATGYSMGGAATVQAVECAPQLFAAAVPMAAGTPWGIYVPTEEEAAAFDKLDVPMMFTTSEFDLPGAMDTANFTIGEGYQECIKRFAAFNGLGEIEFDFAAYEFVGLEADRVVTRTLNGEYENKTWYFNNEAGVPVLAVNYTELLPHGLHPEYGANAWDFMKHYSRNLETGAVEYNPYVQ